MREILFKAKRLDNGEWVEGFPYYADYCGSFIFRNNIIKRCNSTTREIIFTDKILPFEVDGRTYCQYIGIKTINGTKIFEGDKLEDKYGNIGIVKYGYENCGRCHDVYGFIVDGIKNFINEDIVVIGNIYDDEDVENEI